LTLASAYPYRHLRSLGNAQLRAHGSTWYLFSISDADSYMEHILSLSIVRICADSKRVCAVGKNVHGLRRRFRSRDLLVWSLHSMHASIAHIVFHASGLLLN
jgi:hypothetical protein